jgi:hypothetical protein
MSLGGLKLLSGRSDLQKIACLCRKAIQATKIEAKAVSLLTALCRLNGLNVYRIETNGTNGSKVI